MHKIEKNHNKFSRILDTLIESSRVSAASVARNCNIPESTVRRLRNDGEANPTAANLIALANYFNVSIDELLGVRELDSNDGRGGVFPKEETFSKIPILNWSTVITWENSDVEPSSYISLDVSKSQVKFAIVIPAFEYDDFKTQSLALVEPHKKLMHRSYVICHKIGQERATLKQLIEHDGDFYLDSLSKSFDLIKLTDNYSIIGTVIEIRMNVTNTDT